MRNKKGVSLIVLSITILVMAILAATAIIALEDSGIIGRSKNTVSKQNYTEEYTRLQVIKNGILTDNLGTITVDEYITELSNKGLIESGITTNSDGSKTVTTKTGFVANIAQDGTSNLIISLGEANSSISLSPVTLSADITDGEVVKTITATTSNVSGNINWTTSNASIATVTGTNSSATVTMKNVGTATITATYGNAKASCNVTVTGTVATPTITLDKTTISKTIDSGSTATETITATTANISGTLTWTSSNTSVATVSASGNTATVTMKTGGTATITATYGSTIASCTVVVTENAVSLYSLSGVWIFNDTLTQNGWASGDVVKHESVTFTCSLSDGSVLGPWGSFDYYPVDTLMAKGGSSLYTGMSGILIDDVTYRPLYWYTWTTTSSSSSEINGLGLKTTSDGYRTIDFGSASQEVSEEFYNWFTANATQSLITFTLDGVSYQAIEGMTWEQWITCSYNTSSLGLYVYEDSYINTSNDKTITYMAELESADNVICDGYSYDITFEFAG